MSKIAAPAERKPKLVKAYTLQRRGGGFVLLTVLATETDIVDETEVDSRQAQMTRFEDEMRKLA